jgi:hypothetical protein
MGSIVTEPLFSSARRAKKGVPFPGLFAADETASRAVPTLSAINTIAAIEELFTASTVP